MIHRETIIKEKVLKSVRDALIERAEAPFRELDLETPVYHDSQDCLDVQFAENFIRNGGKFVYCEGIQEAIDSIRFFAGQEGWDKVYCTEESLQDVLVYAGIPFTDNPNDLIVRKVGMTTCDFMIARTGSLMFSPQSLSERRVFSALDTHLIVATIAQIQASLLSAFRLIKERYPLKMPSVFTIVNGKSQILDIDGQQQNGFGPQQMYLFLVDTTVNEKAQNPDAKS